MTSTATPPTPASADRNQLIALHASPLAGCLLPFGNLLGPLIFWFAVKTRSPQLDAQARRVLDSQLSFVVAQSILLLVAVCCVLVSVSFAEVTTVTVAGHLFPTETSANSWALGTGIFFGGLAMLTGMGALVLALVNLIRTSADAPAFLPAFLRAFRR